MKSGLYIVFGLLFSSAVAYALNVQEYSSHWHAWKAKHEKQYADDKEELARREQWLRNLQHTQEHNLRYDLGQEAFAMGMNKFSDLSSKEFAQLYLSRGIKVSEKRASALQRNHVKGVSNVPDSVDWRKSGLVTPVKDQGQCGSCWAFSTTGSVEGQLAKLRGQLISLSEEQLVDCSGTYGNNGCDGGLMENAYQYIHDRGIEMENAYPYNPSVERCRYDPSKVVTKVADYVGEYKQDEEALKEMVATYGPVSVAVDARSFQFYSHGIFSDKDCSSYQLDHGVLVVGYDTENGQDYWIVKNSWNTDFGENGYIRIARNKSNMCGIATHASVPRLA